MKTHTIESPVQAAFARRQAADAHLQALEQKAAALSADIEGTRLEFQNLRSEQSSQRYAAAHGESTAVDPGLKGRIAQLDETLEEKTEMLGHLTASRIAASHALEEAEAAHRAAVGDELESAYFATIAELNDAGRAYEEKWAAALASFHEARRFKDGIVPALEIAKREILQHGLAFPNSPFEQVRLPTAGQARHM